MKTFVIALTTNTYWSGNTKDNQRIVPKWCCALFCRKDRVARQTRLIGLFNKFIRVRFPAMSSHMPQGASTTAQQVHTSLISISMRERLQLSRVPDYQFITYVLEPSSLCPIFIIKATAADWKLKRLPSLRVRLTGV